MKQIITLTTDFGLQDEYVGVMKGVILARAPAALLVDLCHAVPRQDIRQAAYRLRAALPYFPPGTIHVAVVDPGVGTGRRLLLVQARQQLFLAPDNGLLSFLFPEAGCGPARAVTCEALFLQPVSATFHGRDILAPVAAALATGLAPDAVGPLVAPDDLVALAWPGAEVEARQGLIRGVVTGVDGFGNLLTSIHRRDLPAPRTEADWPGLRVTVLDTEIRGLRQTYGDGEVGRLLALFGSGGFLEVAVNQGSAAARLGVGPGTAVEVFVGQEHGLLYNGVV